MEYSGCTRKKNTTSQKWALPKMGKNGCKGRKYVIQLKPITPSAQPVLTEEPNQQRTSISTAEQPQGKRAVPIGKAPDYNHFGIKLLICNYILPWSMTFELRENKAFVYCQRNSKLDLLGTGRFGVM